MAVEEAEEETEDCKEDHTLAELSQAIQRLEDEVRAIKKTQRQDREHHEDYRKLYGRREKVLVGEFQSLREQYEGTLQEARECREGVEDLAKQITKNSTSMDEQFAYV